VGIARRAAALESLCAEIGSSAARVVADVADRDSLAQLVRDVSAPFGAPDILVHAAGVNTRQAADDVTPEGWDQTIALNLAGRHGRSDPVFVLGCVRICHRSGSDG